MENIKESYIQFNMEQILPVLVELKLAKNVTEEFISILGNYKESLYEITQKINNEPNQIKNQKENLGKIYEFIMNQIKSIIYKQNPLKKIGSKKETIYERLHRGLLYRYKIENNILAENPEYLTTEKLIISSSANYIDVGNNQLQIFKLDSDLDYSDESNDLLLKNVNLNMMNTQILIAELDIILLQVNNYINIINDDVIHLKLFDEKYLYI